MPKTLIELEAAVNDLTRQGKMLDSINQYYADNCVFVESDGSSRQSKADQLAHLSGFFGTLKSFDGATLHGAATGDDYATSEWTFNMTSGDGSKIEWNEVLVRSWNNGKVVSESYYQK
jgi:ketosteroid isomerase-like protein